MQHAPYDNQLLINIIELDGMKYKCHDFHINTRLPCHASHYETEIAQMKYQIKEKVAFTHKFLTCSCSILLVSNALSYISITF